MRGPVPSIAPLSELCDNGSVNPEFAGGSVGLTAANPMGKPRSQIRPIIRPPLRARTSMYV